MTYREFESRNTAILFPVSAIQFCNCTVPVTLVLRTHYAPDTVNSQPYILLCVRLYTQSTNLNGRIYPRSMPFAVGRGKTRTAWQNTHRPNAPIIPYAGCPAAFNAPTTRPNSWPGTNRGVSKRFQTFSMPHPTVAYHTVLPHKIELCRGGPIPYLRCGHYVKNDLKLQPCWFWFRCKHIGGCATYNR